MLDYAATLFFGLGMLISLIALHPRSAYLELTIDGFLIGSFFRRTFVRWVDVDHFMPLHVGFGFESVGWNYCPTFKGNVERPSSAGRSLVGADAMLPDTYGMSPQNLSAVMNALLQQHGGDRYRQIQEVSKRRRRALYWQMPKWVWIPFVSALVGLFLVALYAAGHP